MGRAGFRLFKHREALSGIVALVPELALSPLHAQTCALSSLWLSVVPDANSVQELQPQKSLPARFELEPAMVQLSIMADVYMAAGWNLWAGDSAVPARLYLSVHKECSGTAKAYQHNLYLKVP